MTFEEAKDQISKELEILRILQADHTRYLTKEEFERLNYLAVNRDKAAAELYTESLRKEIDNLKAQAKFDNVLIEQLQETEKRLDSENLTYRKQITDLKAEIERMKGTNE